MKQVILLFLPLLLCHTLLAQQESLPPGPAISLHYALLAKGPGQDIVNQMKQDGFDAVTAGGFFGGANEYPIKEDFGLQGALLFPFKSKYQVKGLVNYLKNDVTGYNFNFGHVTMQHTSVSIAAVGSLPIPTRWLTLRLGAGPAYHMAKAVVMHNDTKQGDKRVRKPGFILESGFSGPIYTRLYADMQVQYSYAGKGDLGNYTITENDFEGKPMSARADFSNTSLSNLSLSLGLGYRFVKQID